MKTRIFGSIVLLAVLAAPALGSTLLLGNLPLEPTSDGNFIGRYIFGDYFARAVAFTTPNSDYTIDSVTLRIERAATGGAPLITFREEAGGLTPGAVVGTLNNPTLSDTVGDYVFSPIGTIVLNANTTYFLHVGHATNDTYYRWMATFPPNDIPAGNATFHTYRQQVNGGAWATNSVSSGFDIWATAGRVPEPSTLIICVFGLIGCIAIGRSRKPRAACIDAPFDS